jgi:hypothetical protein
MWLIMLSVKALSQCTASLVNSTVAADTIGEQSHRYSIIAVVCMWVNNASSSNRIHEFIPTVAYVVSIVHALVLKTVDVRICLYDSRSSVLMNVSDKSP